MTRPATAPLLPPAVAPYRSGFLELKRQLELLSGFVLIPVELPGPDLARALGQWLDTQGHPAVLVQPRSGEEWERIAASLLEVTPCPNGVVVFIGRYDPPRSFHRGLQFLNHQRDTIAKHLRCPLFWCGPASFLDFTWEGAPDFWSIRSIPHRLLPDADPPRGSNGSSSLRELFNHAKELGDHSNAARLALRVADSLIDEGTVDEADIVIEQGLAKLSAKQIELRAQLRLRKAEIARRRDHAPEARSHLDAIVADPQVDPHTRLRAELLLGVLSPNRTQATAAYQRARDLACTIKDLEGEALALLGLGEIESQAGERLENVLAPIEQARALATKIGDADLEAAALAVMALALARMHDKPKARECVAEATKLRPPPTGQTSEWVVRAVFDRAIETTEKLLDPEVTPEGHTLSVSEVTRQQTSGPSQRTMEPRIGGIGSTAPPGLAAAQKKATKRTVWIIQAGITAAILGTLVALILRVNRAEVEIRAAQDAAEQATREANDARAKIAAERAEMASNLAAKGSIELEALIAGLRAVTGTHANPSALEGLRRAVMGARTSFPLRGHLGRIRTAAFAPDGFLVVTGGEDSTARIWDAQYGESLTVLRGHQDELSVTVFSPDGLSVLTAGKDNTARLWSILDRRLIWVSQGHSNWVVTAAFAPDGRQVVTGSYDGTLRIWRVQDGAEIAKTTGIFQPGYAVFSPDGTKVHVAAIDAPVVAAWDLRSKRAAVVRNLSVISDSPMQVASTATFYRISLSPDGTRAVTAYRASKPRLWNLVEGSRPVMLDVANEPIGLVSTAFVAFSPDGTRIITLRPKPAIWDGSDGKLRARFQENPTSLSCATYSRDAKQIITGDYNGNVQRWDARDGKLLATFEGPSEPIRDLQLSPDGAHAVTLGHSGTARLWTINPDRLAEVERANQAQLLTIACKFLRSQPELHRVVDICQPYLKP